jgi:phosphate transport system permease protein
MELVAWLAAAVGIAILVVVVYSVARRAAPALNLDLFTKSPVPFAAPNVKQGLATAFVGSIVIVGIATAMALPFGILVAIYVNEFAPRRVKKALGLVLDVLNGIPSIVIGIFVFGLIVLRFRQSGLAASFALAIIMLPLVARSAIEVLALVPNSLREAGLGLGAPRWRTTLGVVLPQAVGGMLTGTTLAVARVAGETAPILFTSSLVAGNTVSWNPLHPLDTVTFAIYTLTDSPYPSDHARAWAAGLVLLIFIFFVSLGARWLATRSRRKLGRASR